MSENWSSQGLSVYNVTAIFDDSNNLLIPNTFVITPNAGFVISASMFSVEDATESSIYSSVAFTDSGVAGTPANTVVATITYNSNYALPSENTTETINVIQAEVQDNIIFFNQNVSFELRHILLPLEDTTSAGYSINVNTSLDGVSISSPQINSIGNNAYEYVWTVTFAATEEDIEELFVGQTLFSAIYEANDDVVLHTNFTAAESSFVEDASISFFENSTFPGGDTLPTNISSLGENKKTIQRNFELSDVQTSLSETSIGYIYLGHYEVRPITFTIDVEATSTSIPASAQNEHPIYITQTTQGGTTVIPQVSFANLPMFNAGETANTSEVVYVDITTNSSATNRVGAVKVGFPTNSSADVLSSINLFQNANEFVKLSFSSSDQNFTAPNQSSPGQITISNSSYSESGTGAIAFYGWTNYDVYNESGSAWTGDARITLLNPDNTAYTGNWFNLDGVTVYSYETSPDLYKSVHNFYVTENTSTSDRTVKIKYDHGDDTSVFDTLTVTQKGAYDSSSDIVNYAISKDGGATVTPLVGTVGGSFAPSGLTYYDVGQEAQSLRIYIDIDDVDFADLNAFNFESGSSILGGWNYTIGNALVDNGAFVVTQDPFGTADSPQFHPPGWYEVDSQITSNTDSNSGQYSKKIDIDMTARSQEEPMQGGIQGESQYRRIRFRHKHPENPTINISAYNKIRISQDKLNELEVYGPSGYNVLIDSNASAFEFLHVSVFPDAQPKFRWIKDDNTIAAYNEWPHFISSVGEYQATSGGELGNRKIKITAEDQPAPIVNESFTIGAWASGIADADISLDTLSSSATVIRQLTLFDEADYDVLIRKVEIGTSAATTSSWSTQVLSYSGDGSDYPSFTSLESLGAFTNRLVRFSVEVANFTMEDYLSDDLGVEVSVISAINIQDVTTTQLSPINNYASVVLVEKRSDWAITGGANGTHDVYIKINESFTEFSSTYGIGFRHPDYQVFYPDQYSTLLDITVPQTQTGSFNFSNTPVIVKPFSSQIPTNRILPFNSNPETAEHKVMFRSPATQGSLVGQKAKASIIPSMSSLNNDGFFVFEPSTTLTNFQPDSPDDYNYTYNQFIGLGGAGAENNGSDVSKVVSPAGPGSQKLIASLIAENQYTNSINDVAELELDTRTVIFRSRRQAILSQVIDFGSTGIATSGETLTNFTQYPTNTFDESKSIDLDHMDRYIALRIQAMHGFNGADNSNYDATQPNKVTHFNSAAVGWAGAYETDDPLLTTDAHYGNNNFDANFAGTIAFNAYGKVCQWVQKNIRIINNDGTYSRLFEGVNHVLGDAYSYTFGSPNVPTTLGWLTLLNRETANTYGSAADGFASSTWDNIQAPMFKVAWNGTFPEDIDRSVKLGLFYDWGWQITKSPFYVGQNYNFISNLSNDEDKSYIHPLGQAQKDGLMRGFVGSAGAANITFQDSTFTMTNDDVSVVFNNVYGRSISFTTYNATGNFPYMTDGTGGPGFTAAADNGVSIVSGKNLQCLKFSTSSGATTNDSAIDSHPQVYITDNGEKLIKANKAYRLRFSAVIESDVSFTGIQFFALKNLQEPGRASQNNVLTSQWGKKSNTSLQGGASIITKEGQNKAHSAGGVNNVDQDQKPFYIFKTDAYSGLDFPLFVGDEEVYFFNDTDDDRNLAITVETRDQSISGVTSGSNNVYLITDKRINSQIKLQEVDLSCIHPDDVLTINQDNGFEEIF